MAVPNEMTMLDTSGCYYMNRELSDDISEVLQLQNIGWLLRKAIGVAAVTLHIKHHRDDGVEKIDVDQILTGGLRGTSECRTLDWAEREHTDYIFGRVMGRSRRVALDTVEDAFLRDGWVAHDHGLIESFVLSADNAWTAQQIWGFEEIGGARRYVRHLKFVKDLDGSSKTITRKLVYDYCGPVPGAASA